MEGIRPDSPETLVLLDRAGAGDAEALGVLVDRHRQTLRQFLERRIDPKLGSRVDASDVIQEAQIKVLRRLTEYLQRRPMPFHVWMCRTAYEHLLRQRRRHVGAACRSAGRENALPDQSSILLARQVLRGDGTPSQQVAAGETARLVREALAQLDEADREVLLLRTFEGLSNVEAAQVLDLEPAAASKRYGRALLRLRQRLAAGGITESQA